MSRFKQYAVVEEGTDSVIGQYLYDSLSGKSVVNHLILEIIDNGTLRETKRVFLSSIKKHIDCIKSPFEPERCISDDNNRLLMLLL